MPRRIQRRQRERVYLSTAASHAHRLDKKRERGGRAGRRTIARAPTNTAPAVARAIGTLLADSRESTKSGAFCRFPGFAVGGSRRSEEPDSEPRHPGPCGEILTCFPSGPGHNVSAFPFRRASRRSSSAGHTRRRHRPISFSTASRDGRAPPATIRLRDCGRQNRAPNVGSRHARGSGVRAGRRSSVSVRATWVSGRRAAVRRTIQAAARPRSSGARR
jgi:hypothetical protein